MDRRYRDVLNSKGRSLVDEIEFYARAEIKVEQCDEGPACVVSEFDATICFPNLGSISAEAMIHELLHIQRNWPERVPQLFSSIEEPARIQSIGLIDNDLEHLIIGPRIAEYGFDPHDHWNRRIKAKWERKFWEGAQDARDRRASLLLGFLTAQFLTSDGSLKGWTCDVLREHACLDDGIRFSSEIDVALGSKERTCSIAVHYLGIPSSMVHLALFDIQSSERIRSPVPGRISLGT